MAAGLLALAPRPRAMPPHGGVTELRAAGPRVQLGPCRRRRRRSPPPLFLDCRQQLFSSQHRSTASMAIPLGEPAGEHKALRKQIKKLKKVASTGQLDAAGTAELKSLKKRAKAIKTASQATGGGSASDGGEATAEQAPTAVEGGKGGKKGGKKKRKSDAAAEGAAAEAAPAKAAEQQQQQEQPAKKKAKKGAAAAAEGLPEGMAAVGDRQLAASRPALIKALYSEAAEVAAMSEEAVASWRKERKSKVEGCGLNPITSFAQTGAWVCGALGTWSAYGPVVAKHAHCMCQRLRPTARTLQAHPWNLAPPSLAPAQLDLTAGLCCEAACHAHVPEAKPPSFSLPPPHLLANLPLQACLLRSCMPRARSSSPRPSRRSACPSH